MRTLLDECIDEVLTEVAKKEVKLQDQRIRRDQKKKVDVERLPDAPGESCAGCSELMEDALRWQAIWHREEKVWQGRRELAPGGQTSPQRQGDRAPDRRSGDVQGPL